MNGLTAQKASAPGKRNGTVEVLRFFFCIAVLLFHEQKYILGEASLEHGIHLALFPHGSIGVEFFFVLSGMLMAKSIFRRQDPVTGALPAPTSNEYLRFLAGKYRSIFPQHLVAFGIAVVVWAIFDQFQTVGQLIKYLVDSIPNLLLIQMSGISLANPNHVEWYLSCMLLAMALVYPICRRHYTTFTHYIAPLCSLLILGYLFYTTSSLTGVSTWTGLCFKSLLRALVEISLGTTAFELSRALAARQLTGFQRGCLSIAELALLICSACYMLLTFSKKYEYYLLAVMILLLTISFSQVTWGSQLTQNRLSSFLGKLSLPIYLSQISGIRLTQHFFSQLSQRDQLVVAFALTMVLAAITWLVAEGGLRLVRRLRTQTD